MTFEEFVAGHQRDLLRFSTTLTNDRGLGEDLVQDILIRAHARWARIDQLDHPYTYVRRMLVNEFISWRRKWGRITPRAELVDQPDGTDHTERHAARDAMQRDIARLPRRQRAVIVLRYYEQLPDDEIAALLGCTRSTVRGYAMRALTTLRVTTTDNTPGIRSQPEESMMRTEHDIQDALAAKADEAAHVVDLTRAATPRPLVRRTLPMVGAASAAAAVAIAVPLVVSHNGGGHKQPVATPTEKYGTIPHESISLRQADGTTAVLFGDFSPPCPRIQGTPIACADVAVYDEGVFSAADVAGATPVTVAGRPALFGRVTPFCGTPVPSVAYELKAGRWVTVAGRAAAQQTKDAEVQIASATSKLVEDGPSVAPPVGTIGTNGGAVPAPNEPIGTSGQPVAYRFGFLPHLLCGDWGINPTTIAAVYDKAHDAGVGSTLLRADYRSADHRTTLTTEIYGPHALPGRPPSPPAGSTPVQVDGQRAYVGANTIDVTVGPYTFHITYSGPAANSADLLRIAQGIRLPSDIADRKTWFPQEAVTP